MHRLTTDTIWMWISYVAYVDTNLVGTGKVARAAIVGLQGGVWASSSGYNVRPFSFLQSTLYSFWGYSTLFMIYSWSVSSPLWKTVFAGIQQLSPEEQKAAINAFSSPSETQAHGIKLAGQKFFTLQADSDRVYGKKGVRFTVPIVLYSAYMQLIAPSYAIALTIIRGLCIYARNLTHRDKRFCIRGARRRMAVR